jgi:hypothetical protein
MYSDHGTDLIKLGVDHAKRLIAERLRTGGKKSPAEANALAEQIATGLLAASPTANKPGLAGWKMVPPMPTARALPKLVEFRRELQHASAEDLEFSGYNWTIRLWEIVFEEGRDLPSDVVLTDT